MAAIQISFGTGGISTPEGGGLPVFKFATATICTLITSASSSTEASAACPNVPSAVCRIATDTAIYVRFGVTGLTCTSATGILVPANAIEYIAVNKGDYATVLAA